VFPVLDYKKTTASVEANAVAKRVHSSPIWP
jgi:hypothetical protein